MDWWKDKLINYAFFDIDIGIFTDQKWMEYVFNFVDIVDIYVIKNLGYNVAPWNFSERKIVRKSNKYIVSSREKEENMYDLCFVHYSTFNYKELVETGRVISRDHIKSIPKDVLGVIDDYRNSLIENCALDCLNDGYRFSNYDNGCPITKLHRRLYRRLVEKGCSFDDPFSSMQCSFYERLKKKSIINDVEIKVNNNKRITATKSSDKMEKIFKLLLKSSYKILGEKRYLMLLRGMRKYSKYENNTFLVE